MSRAFSFIAIVLLAGCASNPAFTQAERVSYALTPENVSHVQFWTVNAFQLRGAADLATQGKTGVSAGIQYREAISVKQGTPAVVVEMPDQRTVVVDVGYVLDPLHADLNNTLLLRFAADEQGLYTLRAIAGQPVGGPIQLNGQEYAYFTCNGTLSSAARNKCTQTLRRGAGSDPSVTLRFKAMALERTSGVSGRYISP